MSILVCLALCFLLVYETNPYFKSDEEKVESLTVKCITETENIRKALGYPTSSSFFNNFVALHLRINGIWKNLKKEPAPKKEEVGESGLMFWRCLQGDSCYEQCLTSAIYTEIYKPLYRYGENN